MPGAGGDEFGVVTRLVNASIPAPAADPSGNNQLLPTGRADFGRDEATEPSDGTVRLSKPHTPA